MNNIKQVQLTDEQSKFINLAIAGKNILVDACVGSGKTTSINELCNRFDKNKKILYLTFNTLLMNAVINTITNGK